MVQGWINIVDSNRVDTELLHEGSVTETTGTIAQRITLRGGTECVRTAWLVAEGVSAVSLQLWNESRNTRNANDLEAIVGDIVDKVCALDLYVLYSRGKCCAEQEACKYSIERLSKSVTGEDGLRGNGLT